MERSRNGENIEIVRNRLVGHMVRPLVGGWETCGIVLVGEQTALLLWSAKMLEHRIQEADQVA